ncbi:head-tail connector protein [Dysosmobacter sp.]
MSELTEARQKSLLAYCRIDAAEADESDLLQTLYDSALSYMEQAGVSEPADGTPRRAQYDLCVNYLVLDAYDRRDVTITGTIAAENPAFRRMLNQLKLTESVPDSGT